MYQVTETVTHGTFTGATTVYAESVADALDALARQAGTYLTMASAALPGLVDALERDGTAQLGWADYAIETINA